MDDLIELGQVVTPPQPVVKDGVVTLREVGRVLAYCVLLVSFGVTFAVVTGGRGNSPGWTGRPDLFSQTKCFRGPSSYYANLRKECGRSEECYNLAKDIVAVCGDETILASFRPVTSTEWLPSGAAYYYGIYTVVLAVSLMLFYRRKEILTQIDVSEATVIAKALCNDIVTEAYNASSPWHTQKPHEGVFAIVCVNDAIAQIVGHGFRLGDWLVTASHVLETSEIVDLRLVCFKWQDGPTPTGVFPMAAMRWEDACDDVSVARCPPTVPVRKLVPGAVVLEAPASIHTWFKTSNVSFGNVRAAEFGVVDYSGSTRPGFSGAPYIVGGRVVGIHLAHKVRNFGAAAMLIQLRLKHLSGERREASEDVAVLKSLRGKGKKFWKRVGAGDEFEVMVNGRYYRVDQDEFEELKAYEQADAWEQWMNSTNDDDNTRECVVVRESATDPGNGEPPQMTSGALLKKELLTLQPLLKSVATTIQSSVRDLEPHLTGHLAQVKQLLSPFGSIQRELGEFVLEQRNLNAQHAKLLSLLSCLETRFGSSPAVSTEGTNLIASSLMRSSEASTSKAPPVLESLSVTKPTGTRSAGMAENAKIPLTIFTSDIESLNACERCISEWRQNPSILKSLLSRSHTRCKNVMRAASASSGASR